MLLTHNTHVVFEKLLVIRGMFVCVCLLYVPVCGQTRRNKRVNFNRTIDNTSILKTFERSIVTSRDRVGSDDSSGSRSYPRVANFGFGVVIKVMIVI